MDNEAAPEAPATTEAAPEVTAEAPKAPAVAKPAETTDWVAEARKWETRAKDNGEDSKRWKEYLEKVKPEQEETVKKLADALAELESLKLNSLKGEIATEVNLPANLIPRMRGNTAEELKADAAELLSLFGGVAPATTRPKPLSTQGVVPGSSQGGRAATLEEYENMLKNKFK